MSTQIATAPPPSTLPRRRALATRPAIAGLGFVAAWIAGLAVWPTNPSVTASDAAVVAAYTGHQGVAVAQYVLVEGLAAIAFAVVVIAVSVVGRHSAGRSGRVAVVAGLSAATVSLIECALGLWLALVAVPDGETSRAGVLFDVINRLDGVKMLAFAAMAFAAVGLARRSGLLARWSGYVAAALSAAMSVSGVGYLLPNDAVAQAAAVSLPLLLIWVAGTGMSLGRRAAGRHSAV
jgi:hypothetical protein